MSLPLYLYVPGDPVGWQRAGSNGKRRFTRPKTAAKEREIAQLTQVAMVGRDLFKGAVQVQIIAWMPIPGSWSKRKKQAALGNQIRPTAKPDIDNILKLVLDALNGVAWKDDAAVVKIVGDKIFSANPQTVIMVEQA